MLLSAAIIVKDEARCIVRCLTSLIDAADEIVIVDTGSTDNTIELIEEFRKERKNIRLYHFDWVDDFAVARNFALSKTRGTWKLSIDADEFLHPDDAAALREFCKTRTKQGVKNFIGTAEILNLMNGEVKAVFDFGATRLFTGPIRFQGKIHESLISTSSQPIQREKAPIRFYHDGYDSSQINIVKKSLRNIKYLEVCLNEEPNNPMYRMYFAQEAVLVNREVAIAAIIRAEEMYIENGIKNESTESFLTATKEFIFKMAELEGISQPNT